MDEFINILKDSKGETSCPRWTEAEPTGNTDNLLKALDEMRRKDILCDVTLLVGPDRIAMRAHRNILAASSGRFKDMFPSVTDASVRTLDSFEPELMELFFNFVYTRKLSLEKGNALKILKLANDLHCNDLVEQCSHFIKKFIDIKNCVKVLLLAYQKNFRYLVESAENFIVENLEKVEASNLEFGDLPVDVMLRLVEHPAAVLCDKNCQENEKKLFLLVWNRIRHSEQEKQKYVAHLLEAIHLPQVDRDVMEYIENIAGENPQLQEIIARAKKAVYASEIKEWYLPRYKSKGTVKITENETALVVDETHETKYYSHSVLIQGVPWLIYVMKTDGQSVLHLDSPSKVAEMGFGHKIIAEATYKTPKKIGGETVQIGPNVYFQNKERKCPSAPTTINCDSVKLTITVKFEGVSE